MSDPRSTSIEALADQIIAGDVAAGRPGKPDTVVSDGPRVGCLLWIALALIALVVGVLIGTQGSETVTTSGPPVSPVPGSVAATPTTTATTATTTTTSPPAGPATTAVTGGWDHPVFATAYVDAVTGQPVAGNSILLACMTIRGATPNSYVVVMWQGPGGAVRGTGRVNQSGQVVVAGGIFTPGSYTVTSVQVAPPANPDALTNVTIPATPPTNVTLPNDSICTP